MHSRNKNKYVNCIVNQKNEMNERMNETLHIAHCSSFFSALKLEDIKNKNFL